MNNGPYNLYLKLVNSVDTLTQMFKEDNPHPPPRPKEKILLKYKEKVCCFIPE
jgi:hypothetical protein